MSATGQHHWQLELYHNSSDSNSIFVLSALLVTHILCVWGGVLELVLHAGKSKMAYAGYDKCGPEFDAYGLKPFCCSKYRYCGNSSGMPRTGPAQEGLGCRLRAASEL